VRGERISYSPAEMAWLETNRMMVISDYHSGFQQIFGRPDVKAVHLHGLRKRKGWKVGRAPGRTAGRRRKYSPDELTWLEANRTLPIAEYHAQFCSAFGRADVTRTAVNQLRKKEGWKTGRTGQFDKGTAPPNKGKRCPDGVGGRHPNARRTQFAKGGTPHTWRGPGHESIGDDGYVWVVTDQRNPWTGASTWRVHKHRWLWEQANGQVPDGCVLKSLDGNKLNSDPSNWVAVPRGLLPRLNGRSGRNYDTAPAELKPVIMAVAKLEHGVRGKARA